MIDWLHVALFGLLLAQDIGWLFMFRRLFILLEDLSSTEMQISSLVRSVSKGEKVVSETTIVVIVTSAFINQDGKAESKIKTGLFSTEEAAKAWLSSHKVIDQTDGC